MTDRELMQQALTDCPYTSEELRGAFFDGFMKASTRLAQPEPEPVAWVTKTSKTEDGFIAVVATGNELLDLDTLLYTAPPQREWQGLTDEEIDWVYQKPWKDMYVFARHIEAKLKEKNR